LRILKQGIKIKIIFGRLIQRKIIMKKNGRISPFVLAVISALFIIILFSLLNYVENEGFNPSDDGVVIAQSYRIFNGEIAHKDFISIRPVFSGILHGIHLISPLPLQISARWFVLFEYFCYSFLWVYLLLNVFNLNKLKNIKYYIVFIFLAIYTFLLNLNNYNLYPWTTIDAIFFAVSGLWFYNKLFDEKISRRKNLLFTSVGLLLFSLAALCKQNFILIPIFFIGLTMIVFIRRKEFKHLIISVLTGAMPFIIYFIYLLYNNSVAEFIDQLTGRTELFQTGFAGFFKSFISSWLLPVHIIVLTGFIYLRFILGINNSLLIKSAKNRLPYLFIKTYFVFYLLASIFFSFLLLFNPAQLFKCSFELFWVSIFLSMTVLLLDKPGLYKKTFIIFPLLLAWTSAISLGDNVPVFTTGLLGVSNVCVFFYYIGITGMGKKLLPSEKYIPLLIPLLIIFLYGGIYGQRAFNYRDLPSTQLSESLNSVNNEFGDIKTNRISFQYFHDLNRIIDELGGMKEIKDRIVVLPNNAIFYPLYKTRNPFPLDWLQHEEYIGSEEKLYSMMMDKLLNQEIYLIMDKYNSKFMAFGLKPIQIGGEKYDYRRIIDENCEKVNINSDYFIVLKSIGGR